MACKSDIFSRLKNQDLIVTKGYINGKFTEGNSGKTFPVNDPANGELITDLPNMGIIETKQAIEAAHMLKKAGQLKLEKKGL